jgi:Rrf2 family protein
MKLTRASSYALHALAHMAASGEDRPMASHHIARARGIPELFLLKILKPLVSARILSSVKGPNGGYRLARPAAKISVLDIVEAVDGPIRGTAPLADGSKNGLDAKLEAICSQAAEQVRRQLSKVHLSELRASAK